MSRSRLGALIATVLAAAVLLSPAAGMAGGHRWAPASDREDGALITEPAPALAEPGESLPAAGEAAVSEGPVAIKSPSAVLMEASSGRVLYQKNAHERRNPASITKIMTLVIAFDALRAGKVKLDDKVTISDEAAAQIGTIIFADTGETFSLAELLKSVAVGSANDASVAVAEYVSGSVEAFVAEMNRKAKELGMNDTQFRNPTGLSAEGHFTSAWDIALMSRYAAIHYPELIRLTAIYGDDLAVPWRRNGPTFRLWNNNKLLTWYTGADGLKTGWTEAAGYCLAATAVRDGVRMISVIMGAESWKIRNAEAAKLMDYGFSNYTAVLLAPADKPVGEVRVSQGKQPSVAAVPRDAFSVSVAKGEKAKVAVRAELKAQIAAPVEAGHPVGELVATLEGKEIARMPVVAQRAVGKANLMESMLIQLKRIFTVK